MTVAGRLIEAPDPSFSPRVIDAIVEDRRVPRATESSVPYETFRAVAGELEALTWQVAEMARNEPHQLAAAADYLHGLLEREPLRSNPAWEPQRVVLGMFLLGLTHALARLEVITAAERDALRPAYHRDAVAAVTTQLDPTFRPPPDEEEPVDPQTAAPTDDDADFALL